MGVDFIYPEFEVVRNEDRCIACRVCERQCANEVHRYDAKKGKMISDESKCVDCQRCVSLCPTRALKIRKSDCALRENANWTSGTIKEATTLYTQITEKKSTGAYEPLEVTDEMLTGATAGSDYVGQIAIAASAKGKVEIGKVTDSTLKIKYAEDPTTMKKGTYSYKFTTEGKGSYTLKIVVSGVKPEKAVTFKQQTKLNVTTGQKLVLLPTLKGITGDIDETVTVADENFEAEYSADLNQIIVSVADDKTVAAKTKVDTTLTLEVDGVTLESVPLKFTVQSTKPTVKIAKVQLKKNGKVAQVGSEGTANVLSTYKLGGKVLSITPKIAIDGITESSTADDDGYYTYSMDKKGTKTILVKVNEDNTISVKATDKTKAGSIKVNLSYDGGVTVKKSLAVKLKK